VFTSVLIGWVVGKISGPPTVLIPEILFRDRWSSRWNRLIQDRMKKSGHCIEVVVVVVVSLWNQGGPANIFL